MLKTVGLRKEYGSLTAVNDLNLELEPGDIMGFIGPNGAGKTTTIKMVATLLKPTSGKAYVDGIDVSEHPTEVRKVLGYMPDFFGVYDEVKVWEYLDFFAAAYRMPKSKRQRAIEDVLELTDLSVKYDSMVESLSRGMKQRLCLAKTLLHDPKLLLLDEPASGLDPRARFEIKELLKDLKDMGKTILISSHILPELADFCNKIAVVERGNLVVSGDVEKIMQQARGGKMLEIRFVERWDEALTFLSDLPGIADAKPVDGIIQAKYVGNEEDIHEVLTALIMNGFKISSFCESNLDLEDIFMKVTEGIVA
jgi:ABC-2 type transport system ATP-binding protein